MNQYNRIAPHYQFFSRLMFGKSLISIQKILIDKLPDHGELFMIGGGDGSILPYLQTSKPNLKIIFREASSKMIALAKENAINPGQIEFQHSDSIHDIGNYKYIYAAFFLDLFDEETIDHLLKLSSKNATWYVADFQLSTETNFLWFRRFQIKLSIIFFKFTTQHSVQALPLINKVFLANYYKSLNKSTLGGNFLFAEVFQLVK